MVTIFGLLQALVSIVQDSGDQIHSIKAGPKRIVYLLKKYCDFIVMIMSNYLWYDSSLYFVSVSTTGEPEVVLRQQLEFIYNQILFVLTNKVLITGTEYYILILNSGPSNVNIKSFQRFTRSSRS
jgi:hypothetical protein